MTVTISVVIPIYNGAAFIEETLDSVAAQTLPPSEVIVVDDGSVDTSLSVAQRYAQRGTLPMKVLSNLRQKGACGATNTGIQLAASDFVALQDADDLWNPTHLEQVAGALQRYPHIDVAFSGVEFFGDSDDRQSNADQFRESVGLLLAAAFTKVEPGTWLSNDKLLEAILRVGFAFRCPASLIRRSFLVRTGLQFDEGISYTYDSHFMTIAASKAKFAYLENTGLKIRRHRAGGDSTHYGERILLSYANRVRRLREELSHAPLTQGERRALTHRVWMLQSEVFRARSKGESFLGILRESLRLVALAPCAASAKTCIKAFANRQG